MYSLKGSSSDWKVPISYWKTEESTEATAAHRTDAEPDNNASDFETAGISDTHGGQVAFRSVYKNNLFKVFCHSKLKILLIVINTDKNFPIWL